MRTFILTKTCSEKADTAVGVENLGDQTKHRDTTENLNAEKSSVASVLLLVLLLLV